MGHRQTPKPPKRRAERDLVKFPIIFAVVLAFAVGFLLRETIVGWLL